MAQKLNLTQEFRFLSKIRKANFLLEFSDAGVPEFELVNSHCPDISTSFEEAFEKHGQKKFYLFKIPSEGKLKRAIGYITDVKGREVSARLYDPLEGEFYDSSFYLDLNTYGEEWFVISEMSYKMELYSLDHLNLEDYIDDHTGVDFQSTGVTFLLVAEVPGEGWKEWEVMWLYDKKANNAHILLIPEMKRIILDADYYGDEWFLIPL